MSGEYVSVVDYLRTYTAAIDAKGTFPDMGDLSTGEQARVTRFLAFAYPKGLVFAGEQPTNMTAVNLPKEGEQ